MTKRALFSMGQIVTTSNALHLASHHQIDVIALLHRHNSGDWGDLNDEDKEANENALREWTRIFSSYVCEPIKIWIITEADRSLTTILLPEDY